MSMLLQLLNLVDVSFRPPILVLAAVALVQLLFSFSIYKYR